MLAQNSGDQLFSAAVVHQINIVLNEPSWWDSLTAYKAQSDQTGVDTYLKGDVIIDGDTLNDIGVRLKGNASYSHPGRKKSIVLSFNEYVQGQDYDNLKGIHLNNSAYDPTMLREKLYSDVLTRNGVPAPRCAFAAVSYNGVYCGLFKIIEKVDKTFLQTHFNDNDGNLYKADPNSPLIWEGGNQAAYYDNFELKTNETANDWSDLVQLHNVINNSGTNFEPAIAQAFNVHDYLRALSANNVFGNLDTYLYLPHNYYLYHDSLAAKFQYIGWDVGLAFGVLPENFLFGSNQSEFDLLYLPDPPSNLPLNNNLFITPDYKTEYLNDVCSWMQNEFRTDKLFPRIDSLANVIRPYVYAEADSNRMYSTAQFEGNLGYDKVELFLFAKISGLKDFISKRQGNVQDQLCKMEWSCLSRGSISGLAGGYYNFFTNESATTLTVQFRVPEYHSYIHYRIADMRGHLLADETALLPDGTYEKQFDVSHYAAGVYVMSIDAQCNDIQRKLVIIR